MLCMQQCIDLCDITPEQAEAICKHATLAEIAAIQSNCPRVQPYGAMPTAVQDCDLLDLRDQLLDEVHTAETFADLAQVLAHYQAYTVERDGSRLAV